MLIYFAKCPAKLSIGNVPISSSMGALSRVYGINIGDRYCGQFSSWKSHPTKSIYIKEVPKRVFQVLWNSFPNGKVPTKCI